MKIQKQHIGTPNKLKVISTNGSHGAHQRFSVEPGETYTFEIDLHRPTGMNKEINVVIWKNTGPSGALSVHVINTNGTNTFTYNATSSDIFIQIRQAGTYYLDNIRMYRTYEDTIFVSGYEVDMAYRYGFNSMEKDDEIKGNGNSYDFGARILDPRLGRWLTIDPLASKYPGLSPYNFVANNPINLVDPDGREIIPSDAFKNNTKVSAIFKKLNKTNIMSNITKNFMGERPVVHLMLDVKPLGASPNAYTSPTNLSGNPYAVGITFNSDYTDKASDISIARTMLHESIHAELFRKIESGGGSVNKNDFPGIFDYYSRYGSDGDWQHNQMAQHYVSTISAGLKQFDKENGITDRSGTVTIDGENVEYSSEQFYKGMSYGGLHGTKAWDKLSESDQKLYSKIISSEANGDSGKKRKKKNHDKTYNINYFYFLNI